MQPATDITLEEPEILEQEWAQREETVLERIGMCWFALCGVTKLEYTEFFLFWSCMYKAKTVDGEASNRKEPWKEKRIPIQIGPLRYGLPMTRRGVVQLLPQNPGCMEPLELVGESVRKPSNRDYKIFKAARAQLSPDFELPSPVSQASVMECFERQPRLLLPVQATPDRPIQTEDRWDIATFAMSKSSSSHDQGVPWREVALVIWDDYLNADCFACPWNWMHELCGEFEIHSFTTLEKTLTLVVEKHPCFVSPKKSMAFPGCDSKSDLRSSFDTNRSTSQLYLAHGNMMQLECLCWFDTRIIAQQWFARQFWIYLVQDFVSGVPITDVSFDSLMATLGVSPTRWEANM